ncbi:MAG: CBS domain-containing protein [Lachnospiraceae bacterium]|nr:CBS domain-containing protein [Lachnospiraceae bacterium]
MNVLFYLTPKCDCAYIEDRDTLRQALEKMEARRYSVIPILDKKGHYVGTITEGDLLWNIKNKFHLDLREAERINITEIDRTRDYMPISIRSNMEDLIELALRQNFVPVCDDNDSFIGLVTRQEILRYVKKKLDALEKPTE